MKRLTNFILLFFIAFPGLSAKTIKVCPSCEISSLVQAIKQAVPGDVIRISEGIYKEGNIRIDKALTIIGENYPVFDGEGESEILTIIADSVHIEGLLIQNVGSSYLDDRAGIRIKDSKHFSIINNKLLNTFFGIYLEHASSGIVRGNSVIGEATNEMSSGNAIHLWYCKNVKIEDNFVAHHRDGIYLEFADKCSVRRNISENNLRYGLHFMFSDDDEYTQNEFRSNGAGVAVMFSKNIKVEANIFEKNWGRSSYGLLLKEIYDAEIKNNIFRENTIGIYVEGSTRINYLNNEIVRNGWAIKMSGGCLDNTVNNNNFIGNTFDLSLNSALNNNTFDGNYWSAYSGYDLDRDEIGDIPFHPVKLFNYVVNRTPEAIVLLRSLFVDIINFSEKVSPVFKAASVADHQPKMKKINLGLK